MAKTDVDKVKKYLAKCLLENGIKVNDIALFGSHLDGIPNADSTLT